LMAKAVKQGLEGIVSKDRNLPYHAGRNGSWQKIKTSHRQELIIGGFTDPEGSRQGLGALLMGVHENKKIRYVGRVGTGFNSENTMDLVRQLEKLESDASPFQFGSPKKTAKVHWVKPKLVAEIEFKDWTGDGHLRHASFQGLRGDKTAKEVRREKPQISSSPKKKAGKLKATAGAVTITHPDRLVYPKDKVKKIDVANYYNSVAPWMMPHLAERPLSFLRCPDQAGQNCFFQKHADNAKLTALKEELIRNQKVGYIDSVEGLMQLVQWGVLEPHVWQCHMDQTAAPDQMIFDLDPDEAVSWKEVVSTALILKDLLERLDLTSFVKTTGGKGLHLHVPIAPLYSWEKVKSFSKSVCQQLEQENPGKFTTNLLKKNRHKKIFLDYLRNGFGATAVAPYSLRSKDHPYVAMPIAWSELKKLKSAAAFDLKSALVRLARQKKDPWAGYTKMKQKIKILKPEKF
jgi:bifunctional non-homologous end joining protein LigD